MDDLFLVFYEKKNEFKIFIDELESMSSFTQLGSVLSFSQLESVPSFTQMESVPS